MVVRFLHRVPRNYDLVACSPSRQFVSIERVHGTIPFLSSDKACTQKVRLAAPASR